MVLMLFGFTYDDAYEVAADPDRVARAVDIACEFAELYSRSFPHG